MFVLIVNNKYCGLKADVKQYTQVNYIFFDLSGHHRIDMLIPRIPLSRGIQGKSMMLGVFGYWVTSFIRILPDS